jgi:hypothetical protein
MTTATKAGRYEIVGELGRGAMGVVYKALDPVIGRTVAVKTIRLSEEGTGLSRPELLSRFQTEARAAGLLTHPNIVVVYDAGEEDGLYYITMELVEGKSLQAMLDARQAFPLPRVLRILEQTCSALQFAHERNVVHRDVKPANLMLTADDTVKVTDFGTAKILQFGTVQQTAHVMGTPSYMSPEQVKGRAVDGRSDIFSLGVMLYEMVTGEKPFPGQNITTVIYKIVNEDPVPPRQIDPTIHPGLSAIVMKALAKAPEQRYQSCRDMQEDLKNYRSLAGGGASGASPQSTVAMANPGAFPGATLPLNAALAGRGPAVEDPATSATVHWLNARVGTPAQTAVLRKTGAIQPLPERKKKSFVQTALLFLVFVGVIAAGGHYLRPVWEETRRLNANQSVNPESTQAPAETDSRTVTTGEQPAPTTAEPAEKSPSTSATAEAPPEPKPPVRTAKRSDGGLTARAAEYKGRVEEAIAEHGLGNRARVQGTGNTLTLSGKLRPSEHSTLLKFLRDTPSDVRLVDHIEDQDTSAGAAATAANGAKPQPNATEGAIRVTSNVPEATAILHGANGRVLNRCQTPCSFNNLNPGDYSLELQKDGYQPVQTALLIKAGQVNDQRLSLESLAKGLHITTQPPGADVFINGAKQPGQTPVTLPLAAGSYNLVLRLQGYEGHSETVEVRVNAQTQLNVALTARSAVHVAWAQISTNPAGAEILVDGTPTGDTTPARVQITSGTHTIVLRLNGYQQARRLVQATEGGTVTIDQPLKPKP